MATPPLIDSTRYFFSGDATCRKVMPACAVISLKRMACGCAPGSGKVMPNDNIMKITINRAFLKNKLVHLLPVTDASGCAPSLSVDWRFQSPARLPLYAPPPDRLAPVDNEHKIHPA